ncbi:Nif3-like dinuclear metal center hexameric protein [Sedimentibacter sp. MB31-C6]|uniref:Nif3-like dinuclear metal center hexameric protein n=1 Tax=Sedimentibacter sp. MB31-C6 TaxID=3109366 RepID=UPI002DDCE44C|nr:Nif3-like dinuclear metal center hexameric protein [Sedimentibacter sp. MB36-C1]WSI04176.1 Nif3-like dinuclear metal center hexameric protein [Sedimentibacter sp. MB36-C1]
MKLNLIVELLESKLKIKTQETWDNSGLQIGNLNSDIKNIMLILDLDLDSVKYAIKSGINLIITHHPFIFGSLKSIDFNTYDGLIIKNLILNNINLYSMHTNLDMAEYGVNYKLAQKLSIRNYAILHEVNESDNGYGGIGNIEEQNIIKYAESVKDSLNCSNIKLYCNDLNKKIRKIAFCGGSGSDFIDDAINKGADVYITGDIKYHQAQNALKNNLSIIDAGHYNTEYHTLETIKNILENTKDFKITILEKNTVNEIII